MFGNKTKRAISTSEAMIASMGMYSDYVQDDSEKIASVSNNIENVRYAGYAGMEKIAGIYIDKPTPENIEEFIRRFVHNELTFFPRILEVTVDFIPSAFDKMQKDHVSEGTGVVGIKVFHKALELPFLITDGELMPFDIIQMDGQRVPYSRENLQKIILNLDKQIQQEQRDGGSSESPYLGTEDYFNPSTIPGFMGDVLSIRDTHTMRRGNGQYVTASEYDYGFEKVAEDPLAQMNKVNNAHRQSFMGGVAEEKESAEEDMLGLGIFSNSRRTKEDDEKATEKILKEKSTTPAPEGEEEKTAGLKQKFQNFSSKIGARKEIPTGYTPTKFNPSEEDLRIAALPTYKVDGSNNIVGKHDLKNVGNSPAGNVLYQDSKGNYYDFFHESEDIVPVSESAAKQLYPDVFTKQAEIVTDLNALLEKSASIEPMKEEEYDAITFVLQKHAAQKEKDYLEKLAAEEEDSTPTRKELRDAEAKANFRFDDARNMAHGTFIIFPEMIGDEISLTPAVVLSDFSEIKVNKRYDKFKCVISQDGRMKILDGEKFLCKEAPDRAFKFPTDSFSSLTTRDVFFALMGDKVLPPSVVDYSSDLKLAGITEDNSVKTIGKCVRAQVITASSSAGLFSERHNEGYDMTGRYGILTLNDKKFEYVEYNDFLQEKAKEQVLNADIVNAVVPKYDLNLDKSKSVLATDPHSKVIKIKGTITSNFKTQDEYALKTELSDAGYENEKVAFSINTITITCTDRRNKTYNVTVEYRDTDERFMNLRRQQFNTISEGKLRAILRITKFEGSKINEIIYKAKNEPKASYPIPTTCTIEDIKKLQGGSIDNVSKETVKAAVGKYINPYEITKALAVATAADMFGRTAAKVITPNNVGKLGKVFNFVNKIAEESSDLSASFEKLAATYENEDYLDYAKALATSSYFHEKIATALNDERNHYPSLVDVAHEIVMAKPVLEKFAYDLTALKINQQVLKQEQVNPSLVSHAILGLDQLYKTARAIETGIDKDKLKFM